MTTFGLIELKALFGLALLIFGITLFPFVRALYRIERIKRKRPGRNLKNYMRGHEL